jgi:hypothetical protein
MLAGALLLAGIGAAPASAVDYPAPIQMSYVVVPHPDDEWETWALVENSPANYKVFIIPTTGDQTGYCTTPAAGAPAPVPMMSGKWTPECSQARINSWLNFTTGMSQSDPSVPGDWQALGNRGPFPANGTALTRQDGGAPYAASRAPLVFLDRQGRGAAVFYDLGDGDLTEQEVVWAIKTTMDNRAALGINSTLPNYNILGGFSNKYYANCAVYDHPDHYSLHRAIYHYKFAVVYQSAATCRADTDTRRTVKVSQKSSDAAFTTGTGHFRKHYGWLGTYGFATGDSQLNIFMQSQSFWIRYN